jgi:hypothetical protein
MFYFYFIFFVFRAPLAEKRPKMRLKEIEEKGFGFFCKNLST